MSNLSKEQLVELTERVNARLAEFGNVFVPSVPGVVRLTHDVIQEWAQEQAGDSWCELEEAVTVEVEVPTPEDPPVQKPALSVVTVADDPTRYVDCFSVSSGTPGHVVTNGNHTEPLSHSVIATLGPEHVTVTPLKGRGGNALPTLRELVAEVKRQSMGGMMPTMEVFNNTRPATWATAQAHLSRLGVTWEGLAEEAGLKLKPRGVK